MYDQLCSEKAKRQLFMGGWNFSYVLKIVLSKTDCISWYHEPCLSVMGFMDFQ